MDYEIVELKEKTVAGLTIITSNKNEHMKEAIGSLWQHFFGPAIYSAILHKKNIYTIGLYSDYENDANGAYKATVCCEVTNTENLPIGVISKVIPSGKYAKFIVKGNMQTVVGEFWAKLWAMDLNRKYTCDFEEYQNGDNTENCEIHMFISVK